VKNDVKLARDGAFSKGRNDELFEAIDRELNSKSQASKPLRLIRTSSDPSLAKP